MARAKLHLICGNCGSDDEWEWSHIKERKKDNEIEQEEDVFLICLNCAVMHRMNDNAQRET